MKSKLLFCLMTLLLGLSSCSESKDDAIIQEPEVAIDPEDDEDFNENPYFWELGKKRYVSYSEQKSLILYYGNDREKLYSSLSELDVNFSKENEVDYQHSLPVRRSQDGPGISNFNDSFIITVNADYKSLAGKVSGAYIISPFIILDNREYSLDNLIWVYYNGSTSALNDILKKHGTDLVMVDSSFRPYMNCDMYLLWCTPESNGNALEIADKLHKTGKFISIELHSLAVAHLE